MGDLCKPVLTDLEKKNINELIKNELFGVVINFLWYDRKEDEELKMGYIEAAIEENLITIDEIVETFKKELVAQMLNGSDYEEEVGG